MRCLLRFHRHGPNTKFPIRLGTIFDAYLYPVEPPCDTDVKSLKKAFRRAVRDFLKAAAA